MRMYKEICFESVQPEIYKIDSLIGAIPPSQLTKAYELTCNQLSYQHKATTIKTHSEIYFANRLKSATRLEVLSSVWIGRFCVDFFIPGIGGELVGGRRRMKGLVLEINGPVHDFEPKMTKDENHSEVLLKLGIGTVFLENADLNSVSTNALISKLKMLPRLNWRAKQRVKNRVYAWTIMANNSLYLGGDHE